MSLAGKGRDSGARYLGLEIAMRDALGVDVLRERG